VYGIASVAGPLLGGVFTDKGKLNFVNSTSGCRNSWRDAVLNVPQLTEQSEREKSTLLLECPPNQGTFNERD
jgi:hypothetical protein